MLKNTGVLFVTESGFFGKVKVSGFESRAGELGTDVDLGYLIWRVDGPHSPLEDQTASELETQTSLAT